MHRCDGMIVEGIRCTDKKMPAKKKEKPNLDEALENDDADAVRRCLRDGADPNFIAENRRSLPFICAAEENSDAVVRALVEGGADINLPGKNGNTPLSRMCGAWGPARVTVMEFDALKARIRLLVELGADVNAIGKNDTTPLLAAIHGAGGPIVELLLNELGADPTMRSFGGTTPLMYAALYEDVTMIDALVRCGCPLNATNENGISALHITAITNNPVAARALLGYGAEANLADRYGATPHDYAVLFELPELAEILRTPETPAATEDRLRSICDRAHRKFREYVQSEAERLLSQDYFDANFEAVVTLFANQYFSMNDLTVRRVFDPLWPQFLKLVPPFAAGHYATTTFEFKSQGGAILDFFYDKEPLLDVAIAHYERLGLAEFEELAHKARSIYYESVVSKIEALRQRMRDEYPRDEYVSGEDAVYEWYEEEDGDIPEGRLFDDIRSKMEDLHDAPAAIEARKKAFEEYLREES